MNELLGLAAVDAVRWWLTVDGPHLVIVDSRRRKNGPAGQLLDAKTVERLSKLYGVRRNMVATGPADELMAETFGTLRRSAGATLHAQAQELTTAYGTIKSRLANLRPSGTKDGQPYSPMNLDSGLSKLSWFVQPERWTPFDNLASTGVGIRTATTRMTRMERFYTRLDELKFLDVAAAVDALIERYELNCRVTEQNRVHGERALDRFLMFNGMKDGQRQSECAVAQGFLECAPEPLGNRLQNFFDAIQRDQTVMDFVKAIELLTARTPKRLDS
ncbi:hypothetical protein N7I30_08705 [Aurantimonas litoralis]|nr:hypothetical protein [Aurantimonas litoralis]